jgi:hypothetical protein
MKLVRSLALASFGLSAVVAASVAGGVGCGSSVSNVTGDGGTHKESGTSSEGGGNQTGTTPPKAPSGPATTSTTATNFAVHQLFLGDTDYNGTPDMMAWANFGYNIDGKITTASSTNVCKLVDGGGTFGPTVQVDGNGGIDNSFGENIYQGIILMVDSTASSTINSDINSGTFTLMFDIVGLTSSSTQTNTGLTAQAFAGGTTSGMPQWGNSSYNWPILGTSGLLSSTNPPTSTIQFPHGYVVNGTWVSGDPTTIMLSLSLDGISFTLPINQAVITFQHSSPTHGGSGVISGVIPTAQLTSSIMQLAGHFSASLCNGTALNGILAEVTDSSDIMAEPTNGSLNPGPSVTCNAISIGLGFTVDEIGPPTTIAPMTCAKPDPCSDAAVPACDAGGPTDSGMSDTGHD